MMKIITEKVIDSKFRVEMVQKKIQEHIVTEKEALIRKIIIALLVLVMLLITEGFLFSKLLAIRSEMIDDQELTGEVPFKASTESLSLHPTSGSTTNSQTFSETSTESTSIGTAQSTTTTRTSINSESDVNADGTGSTTSNYPETSGTVSSLLASKPRQLELSSSRRTFLQTTPFEASTESPSSSLPEATHESPNTVYSTSGSTANSQTFSETSTESTSTGTAQSTTTTHTSLNSESDVNTNGTGTKVGSTTSSTPETSGTVSSLSASKPRQLELSSSRRTFLQTTPFEASTESPSSSLPEATHESPNTVHSTSGSTANSQTFSETSTESTSIGTTQSTTTTHTSINSESDVNTNGTGTKVGSTTSSTPATSANLTACSNITDCSDLGLGFVCLNSTCSCDVSHKYHSASGTCQGMWSEWSDISRKKISRDGHLGGSNPYPKMATCTKMISNRTRECLADDGSCPGLSTERNETELTCFCHQCCKMNHCLMNVKGFTPCFCGNLSPRCIQSNCPLPYRH